MSTLYLRMLKFVIIILMTIICWRWLCEIETYNKFEFILLTYRI